MIDELLEHSGQALLGDVEDIQQVGDAKAGVSVHKMQDTVVRPAKSEIGKDRIRVAGEVAIGEEQKLRKRMQMFRSQSLGGEVFDRPKSPSARFLHGQVLGRIFLCLRVGHNHAVRAKPDVSQFSASNGREKKVYLGQSC